MADTEPFRIPLENVHESLMAIENKLNGMPLFDFDAATNTLKVFNRSTGVYDTVILTPG